MLFTNNCSSFTDKISINKIKLKIMRKIGLLVAIVAFALCLVSCGSSPVGEAEKLVKLTKELNADMTKATEDGVISDDEAKKINDSLKDFQNLMSKLEKYENDKEVNEYLEKEGFEAEVEKFAGAIVGLIMCESADKIDLEGLM